MGTNTLTGSDTLVLFGRVMTDLADADVTALTFPDDLLVVKTGKNRNTIYAQNESGNNAELVIRINRGSDDDKFLQGKLNEQKRDLSTFTTGKGQFTKHEGDGQGNVTRDIYNLVGGVFTKNVEGKDNTDGDVEQAVSVYNMKFSVSDRNLA